MPRRNEKQMVWWNTILRTASGQKQRLSIHRLCALLVLLRAVDERVGRGKWVSHGILLDVNSDRIKGESYGSLKENAGVLTEAADVRVVIVGHTDSDGDTAANLDLSRRRAESVKAALVSEFKIFYLGADTFPRSVLFLIVLLAIPAWFFGFTLERRVSRFRAYRVVRDCIRCVVGLSPWVYALGAPADASSGGALALYPFLFAGGFLLVKRADRVLGFRG